MIFLTCVRRRQLGFHSSIAPVPARMMLGGEDSFLQARHPLDALCNEITGMLDPCRLPFDTLVCEISLLSIQPFITPQQQVISIEGPNEKRVKKGKRAGDIPLLVAISIISQEDRLKFRTNSLGLFRRLSTTILCFICSHMMFWTVKLQTDDRQGTCSIVPSSWSKPCVTFGELMPRPKKREGSLSITISLLAQL